MVGSDHLPGWDSLYGSGRVNAFKVIPAIAAGDANDSGMVDIDDIVYPINYVFADGPSPHSPCFDWME